MTAAFIQGNKTAQASGGALTIAAAYATIGQTLGNCNVVCITAFRTTTGVPTISSVADTSGNVYRRIVGNAYDNFNYVSGGWVTQEIWYSPNIAAASAGSNTVTATFSSTASQYSAILIHEISGVDTYAPLLAQAHDFNGSNNATMVSGTVFAPGGSAIVFAYFSIGNAFSAVGSGYTLAEETTDTGQATEYQIVTGGFFSPTMTQTPAGDATGLSVVFGVPPPPPPKTQQRSPRFPPPFPIPGVALLGGGILAAAQPVASAALVALLAGVGAMTADPSGSIGALVDTMSGTGALTATVGGAGALACTMGAVGGMTATGQTALADVGAVATQVRAPGFPLSAPIPGVPLLGTGVLAVGGATPGPLAATLAGVGALSATLAASGALTDTMAGSGALSATLSGAGALSDTMNGVGALTATVGGAGALTDTMNGVGAITATLGAAGALVDTMAAVGALSGTIAGAGELDAVMTGSGALNATLAGAGALSCTMAGVGALLATVAALPPATPMFTSRRALGYPPSAPLPGIVRLGTGVLQTPPVSAPGAMIANMTGVGAMTATPSGAGAAVGTFAGVGGLTASAAGGGGLSGTFVGVGALAGTLGGAGGLADTMAGVGALTATPSSPGALVATLAGIGAMTAALTGSGALGSTMGGVGALGASLTGGNSLVATLAGTGAFVGVIVGAGAAASTMAGTGALAASMAGALRATFAGVGALSAMGVAPAGPFLFNLSDSALLRFDLDDEG